MQQVLLLAFRQRRTLGRMLLHLAAVYLARIAAAKIGKWKIGVHFAILWGSNIRAKAYFCAQNTQKMTKQPQDSGAKRTELAELGEFGLIERLTKPNTSRQKSTEKSIGDDAAVLNVGTDAERLVVSTDMLVEDIHFDLSYTPLRHLGYKSVAVNVSDIYAMNAKPTQITLSIAISNRFSVEALEEFYAGVYIACEEYGVDLVGGDTTSSRKGFIISVTAIGTASAEKIAYRNGAKLGDLICVTGDLGGAYLGLQLLEREKQIYLENPKMQPDLVGKDYLVGRILRPKARRDMYDFLQKMQIVPTSMIDVSDGLSSELMHICTQSKVGALIEESNLPIAQETWQQAMDFSIDATTCALHGGEDYELLFTINPAQADKLRYQTDIRIIGDIMPAADGLQLQSKAGKLHPLRAQGWKHV